MGKRIGLFSFVICLIACTIFFDVKTYAALDGGTSAADAPLITSATTVINITTNFGTKTYFKIIPSVTATYTITTDATDSFDPVAFLFCPTISDANKIAQGDDENGYNPVITAKLTAGSTYYLKIYTYDPDNTCTCNLSITGGGLQGNATPVISINSPTANLSFLDVATASISGTVNDADGNDVTVSASIDGHSASTTVSHGSGNWTLTWNTAGITENTYKDIIVTANDGLGGTGTSTYTGNIIIGTHPTITGLNPADNNTNVGVNTNLVINFSENVVAGTGNIIVKTSGGTTVETIAANDSTKVSGSGSSTITINPATTLDGEAGYYIEIDTNAFKDTAGNSYTGISGSTAWNFTTAPVAAPTANSFSPADNAVNVGVNDNLVINFSENVVAGAGNITIKRSSDGWAVETIAANDTTKVSGGGTSTITINPATTLIGETGYYVEIEANAFKDSDETNYAGISNSTGWNFTTADVTAPTVNSFSPADNAVNVGVNDNLVIHFSENVVAGTGNITIKRSSDGTVVETITANDITKVSGSGTSTITINPATELGGEIGYYVAIDATAFKDMAGNGYAGVSNSTGWNFTAADINAPSIVDRSPGGGATNMGLNDNLIITFNEKIIIGTGNVTIKDSDGNVVEIIDVTDASRVSGDGSNIITINPATTLTERKSYYVLIDATAFQDAAGNHYPGISAATFWKFTTTDATVPTLSSMSPADNATGVGINTDLVLTFSEIVNIGTGYIKIVKSSDNIEVEVISVTDATKVTGGGSNTITVNPTTTLAGETSYYIKIDAAAFHDTLGNGYGGISGVTTWNFTTVDITAPTLSGVTPTTLKAGTAISATSSEAGTLYLVPKGTYANQAALAAASTVRTAAVTAASPMGSLDTTSLGSGTYQVYAVDTAGNLSSASADIVIDNIVPTLSGVTPTTLKAGTAVSATSSEAGTLYLVTKGTYANQAALAAVSAVRTAAVTVVSPTGSLNTTGLGSGTYQVYAVDIAGNLSSASADIIIDNTVPTVIGVTPTLLKAGTAISATSSEAGTLYLVPKGTYANQAALAAVSTVKTAAVTAASPMGSLDTTGLVSGTYQVYAVDIAGNLSSASADIVIDSIAPTLSGVTPTTLQAGTAVSATSSEAGTLYLVPKGTYANQAALVAASTVRTAAVTAASPTGSLDTTGLGNGTYQVYAVDIAGNLSSASADIVIDNTVPTLSGVTPTTLKAGTAVSATSSEAGTLYLVPKGTYANQAALAAASTVRTAAVTAGSLTGSLDTTGLGSGTYQVYAVDTAGNLSSASTDIIIDNTAPTVSLVDVPAGGTYVAGQSLDFTVNFSEAVNVTTAGGTPSIPITLDSGTVEAVYVSGSGTTALLFRYAVVAGNQDDNGIMVGSAITVNGGTLKDAAENNATLTLNGVGSTSAILIDTTTPSVSSVNVPAGGAYIAGQNLDFTVNFNKTINVTTTGGTPYIPITLNTGTVRAAYLSGSGTTTLLFRYTVVAGNQDGDGISVGSTITANGGTLKDATGNSAALSLNGVDDTSAVLVDTVTPTVNTVGVPGNGTYVAGQNLIFTVNFSETITVSTTGGTPYIPVTLNTGGTVQALYYSGNGTSSLVFRYTVVAGNQDGDGISVGSTITANGGTLKDAAGNSAALSLNGIGNTSAVLVDAVIPTVNTVGVPGNGTYVAGQNLDLTVNFSEAVTVSTTGGTPYIPVTLNTGGTIQALYYSGNGTSSLVFRYTVVAGNQDGDGISVGSTITANGGTLKDATGNSAALSLNGVGDASAVLVDAVTPTVNTVGVPGNGTYITGQNLDFTVNFSEAVTVSTTGGTPYIPITLNTGGTVQALYYSGNGTSSLVFRYTVVAGNQDGDGISMGSSITANGGTLKDAAGNNAVLSLNGVGNTSAVLIDAVTPTVNTVGVPGNGTYVAGQNLDFTVNFSEAVTVSTTGGTPYIPVTLNTGGTAQALYYSGNGTSSLVFRYTVVAGNQDGDGISVGSTITANGGTLKDAAGNSATLSLNGVGNTSAVFVDAIIPTLSTVTIVSNNSNTNKAKTGDRIILNITASKSIGAPTVTICGNSATVNDKGDTDPKTWQAAYTMQGTENEGTEKFSISFSDLVGNIGTTVSATTDNSSVVYDKTIPTVTAYSPAVGSTKVKLNAALALIFSEAVTAGNGNVTIYKEDGTLVETIAASQTIISDKTVTIAPTHILSAAANYYVLMDAMAFKDKTGNAYAGIASTSTWNFTTVASAIAITFSRPTEGAKLNINTGSTVIVKLTDNGAGIDTSKITVQVDGGTAVKATKLIKTDDGYTLYYVITHINYGTADNAHTITVTASDLSGTTSSGTVTFYMEPKRNGFGFGKLRFD